MSYGPPEIEQGRQADIYTGRILEGEKPSDMPGTRVTRFEFIINLATARAIGVEVPRPLLATREKTGDGSHLPLAKRPRERRPPASLVAARGRRAATRLPYR